MRTALAVALLSLVVLAGCSGLSGTGAENATATSPASTDTVTPDPATDDTSTARSSTTATTSADTGEDADGTVTVARADPPTDVLGWEAGYWHNESIAVDNSDGMNATERRKAVARAMARVEYVRQLEFETNGTIPITVVSRTEHRNRTLNSSANHSDAFRTFDNTKFEAMFFVGEDTDSLAVQQTNRASTTQGYYDLRNDSIVLISEGGLPQFNGEQTLAQEVGHALQDSRFNVTAIRRSVDSRDALNGQNGLIEGDGNLIDERYVARCGDEWECIPKPGTSGSGSGGGSADVHVGINMMRYFPYSDGPPFIEYHYDRGGWDAIDAMYADPPQSAEQVIYPEKYGTDPPTNVTVEDTNAGGWELVNPPERSPNATLGQSVITSMFAYTWLESDYRRRGLGVVRVRDFVNYDDQGRPDADGDLFDYDIAYSSGWEGDTMHVYTNADAAENETAYVWRLEWETESDAREFVDGYGQLLRYWGGEEVDDRDGVYRIDDSRSPFTDTFAVWRSGTTVTVVNAPEVSDLGDVSDGVE
jgi:hypothetical protein